MNNYPAHVFEDGACGALRGIWKSKGQAIARDAQLVTTVLSLPVMIVVVALMH